MSFTSIDFIIFFAAVLFVVVLLERFRLMRAKEIVLLIASYFFYCYGDWRFGFLLLFITVTTYVTARCAHKKACVVVGVIVPLIVLGFFKYFGFFVSSLGGGELGALCILLPMGISFYAFQAISYVVDVKRGKIEAEKNFVRLALYISFFPKLISGPVVRAGDFLPQLKEERRVTRAGLEAGLQLIVFGLFKKMVLADHMSVFVDDVFTSPAAYHWSTLLLGMFSYSLLIYFDFSGYSDIAIGCAKCLGYDFKVNFNLPYISATVTELWKRWHISLSSWLQDYLYISLGGNRKGKVRQYLNLMLTMLLGGLWHGANWTFVAWGGMHGAALCLDKVRPHKWDDCTWFKCISTITTFLFVSFAWVFFRADSFDLAWQLIRGIFTGQDGVMQPFVWSFVSIGVLLIATIVAVIRSKQLGERRINGFCPTLKLNTVWGMTIFLIACGLILCLAFSGEAPFVYGDF